MVEIREIQENCHMLKNMSENNENSFSIVFEKWDEALRDDSSFESTSQDELAELRLLGQTIREATDPDLVFFTGS